MRGSLKQRYQGSWSIILDLGYERDPVTGKQRRRQKWFTVRGTRRDAQIKLAELLHNKNQGHVIEPSRMTLGDWLEEWLKLAVTPPKKRPRTYETYVSVIKTHLNPNAWPLCVS